MNRILVDLIAAGRQYLRSRMGAFFTFVFPILLVLLFGAIFTATSSGKVTLPVQNLDEGVYGNEFLQHLNETGIVTVEMIPTDANLTQYWSDHSLTIALYIPQNFTDHVIAAQGMTQGSANVTLYGDPSQSTTGVAQAAVSAVAVRMNYILNLAIPYIGSSMQNPPAQASFVFMDFFIPGVVGMTVMTNSLFSMTSICATYRNRSYFKLLATTKLKRHEWLLSHFILYSLLMYASLITTFVVGKLAFNLTAVLTPTAFLLIPAGAFLFVSLGMLVGSAVRDPESAVAIANAIGFPMMFLSGSFFPIESFPHYLQAVARALPLTYLNDGLRDTMVNANTAGALVNLGVVVIVGLVIALLASRLMSWKEK